MAGQPSNVYSRALHRAADILGGKAALRAALHVPMARLDEWLEGVTEPPMEIFLKAVDIISTPMSDTPRATAAAIRARLLTAHSKELIQANREHIVRARELRDPRSRPQPSESTARFLAAFFSPQERGAMLDAALDAAIDATQAQMGNVQLRDENGLRIVAHRGFDAAFLEFFACVTHKHGATCGAAMERGGRVIVTDVVSDPIFLGTQAALVLQQANVRAVQSTPLVSGSGEVLGMLSTHFDRPHRPADDELTLVDRIAERTASLLDSSRA